MLGRQDSRAELSRPARGGIETACAILSIAWVLDLLNLTSHVEMYDMLLVGQVGMCSAQTHEESALYEYHARFSRAQSGFMFSSLYALVVHALICKSRSSLAMDF